MSHDLLSRLKQSALSEFLSAESLYQLVDHVGCSNWVQDRISFVRESFIDSYIFWTRGISIC